MKKYSAAWTARGGLGLGVIYWRVLLTPDRWALVGRVRKVARKDVVGGYMWAGVIYVVWPRGVEIMLGKTVRLDEFLTLSAAQRNCVQGMERLLEEWV